MGETVLFGRYRLIEPAGSGGSAQVWRALDTETGDEVAVKRLHPVVFADASGRQRLEREFKALRGLDAPHVVRVRELHVTDDEAALVLDYVDGRSVAERLSGGPPFSAAETLAVIDDVAEALAAAHGAGIVHRDVTPGNILLDPNDGARLTDFGIALGGAGATAVTATGELMGTLRYLAPEQLRGEPATPSSDLHALAAVAYEMLAGRPVYAATTPVALAEAHGAGPEPLGTVPPSVDAAVRRGLATDPGARPADVRAFAAELRASLEGAHTVPVDMRSLAGSVAAAGAAPALGPMWSPASEPAANSLPDPAPGPGAAGESRDPSAPLWTPLDAAGPDATTPPPLKPRRRSIAVPIAALGALFLAAAAIAALGPAQDQPAGADAATDVPATLSPAPTPAATPVPVDNADGDDKPEKPDKDDDKDDDKGKGKGNGNGNGNGNGD